MTPSLVRHAHRVGSSGNIQVLLDSRAPPPSHRRRYAGRGSKAQTRLLTHSQRAESPSQQREIRRRHGSMVVVHGLIFVLGCALILMAIFSAVSTFVVPRGRAPDTLTRS